MKRFVLLWLLILPAMAAASWAAESPAGWVATPGDDWRAVDLSQTAVAPSSVLDMSRFIEAPAGKYGRIVLDAQGHLVFEKNPSQRALFFGCSISPEGLLGRTYTTHEEIRRWAGMVRQQGYNLVRPHFLDHYLTRNSSSDLEFDSEALDRFDYLVACLKEHGIYLYFDAMTSWRGFNKGNGWTQQAQATEFKSRIFVEDAVREHWKTGVRKLLQHVNPYTQTRLVDDPVVAVVLFFNEQNLNFYRSVNPHYTEPWRAWLKKKYGTTDALRRAWVDTNGRGLLKEGVALENVPLFDSKNIWQADPRGRDLGLFVYEAHAELLEWYTKSIRELGYTGLVTHYDWLNHLGIQALRNRVPVISMHGYHAHPSEYTSPGSKVSQESSVAAGNRLFCSIATTRYNDRPLLITEYGQVFWNRYRYEEGLLMGCYAALQDIDGLMAHATPVLDHIDGPIHPFWVAHDPIARASQVVSGFAYLRRDVTPSPHRVEIPLQNKHIFEAVNHARALSADQARLALLTGVGLSYADEPAPDGLRPRKADLRLPVFGTSETLVKEFFSEVRESLGGEKPLIGVVAALKKHHLMPQANRTDPAQGIFESDTGQLFLSMPSRQFQVIAPRMEGACLDPEATPGRLVLKQLSIESTSVPASITLIAVDDRPLDQSRRLLLVYATDALNSGMAFTSPQREELVGLGKLPVLMRTGYLKLTIKNPHAAAINTWALGLDGRRVEPIGVTRQGDALTLSIDGRRLKSATPFFELAADR